MAVPHTPRTFRTPLTLDTLEARTVPAAGMATIREAAATSVADIAVVRDQFRADLGDARREVNWDGVPDSLADPNNLPGDLFAGRGLLLATNGTGFKVSGDPAVVGDPASRFGTIDPTYRTAFKLPFSDPRLFTPVGTNVTDVTFVMPGTDTPATVRGFGAVFSDVDTTDAASIEFFDRDGESIFKRSVLAQPGDGGLSFLGASYDDPIIATVRITSGTGFLAAGIDDVTQGGNVDLVVLDDFVFAEPGASAIGSGLPDVIAAGIGAGGSPLATTYNDQGQTIETYTAFNPSFTGGVRVAVGDFNLDGVQDVVFGTGPGIATQVRVVDGKSGATIASFQPFELSYTGGVFVSVGDLTGDGRPDLVVSPDEGGGPRVQVYDGNGFGLIADFFGINDPDFRGGVRTGVGDVNGDGRADLVVGAGFGGGPRVAVFDGPSLFALQPLKLLPDFFAFEPSLRDGVYPAVGDVDGDGFGDLILGSGPQGGPRVLILRGDVLLASQTYFPVPPTPQSAVLASFFSGDPNARGGIRVAVADLDGDTRADVVTGAGDGDGTQVRSYLGVNIQPGVAPPINSEFTAFPGFDGGVFVG